MPSPRTAIDDLDDVSIISGGSTISVASGGLENGHRPQSGHKRSNSNQGKRPKPGKSPYAIKHPPSPRAGQGLKVTTRDMWLTSMRSGSAGLTTQMHQGSNTWADGRPKHANNSAAVARSNINLFNKTFQANGKTKNHSRSASATLAKGPAYKTQEEYYDEVIVLKKTINDLKAENDLVKTKLNRVEGENVLKNRRIEELLNPNQQQEELRRTLTNRKPDSSAVVSSLKQKLHNMERTVKDKESELGKLKKDMRSTDISELRVQLEAYHQEVNRLNMVLMDTRSNMLTTNPVTAERPKSGRSERRGGTNASHENRSVEMLKEQNRQLQLDNQSLRKDLVAAVNGGGREKSTNKGDYADMNRVELLHTIHELEEKLQQAEQKSKTKSPGKDTEDDKAKNVKRGSKDFGAFKLSGSPSERIAQLQEREQELLGEVDKQKNTIEKLKEDRTHYRKVADELRQQLENTEKELQSRGNDGERKQSLTRQQSLTRVQKEREVSKDKEVLGSQQNEEDAALVLQKNWRKHRQWKNSKLQGEDEKRRNEEDEYNQAVVDIQAALRSHSTRCQRMDKEDVDGKGEDISNEDAVIVIQSAARGHLVRKRHYDQLHEEENKQLGELRYKEKRSAEREEQESLSFARRDHFREENSSHYGGDKIVGIKDQELRGSASTAKGHEPMVARRPGVRQSSIPLYKNASLSDEGDAVTSPIKKQLTSSGKKNSFSKSRTLSKNSDSDEDDAVVVPSKKTNTKYGKGTDSYSKLSNIRQASKERQESDEESDDVIVTSSKRTDLARRMSAEKERQENKKKTKNNSKGFFQTQQDDSESEDNVITTTRTKGKQPLSSSSRQNSKTLNTNIKDSPRKGSKSATKKSGFEIAESDSDEGVVMQTKQTKVGASSKVNKKGKSKPQKNSQELNQRKKTVINESDDDDDDDDDIVMTSSKRPISARRGSGLKTTPSSTGKARKSTMDDLFSSSKRSSKSSIHDSDDDDDDIITSSKKSAGKRDSGSGAASMWGPRGSTKKSSASGSTPFGSKNSPKRNSFSWNKQSDDDDDVISSSKGRKVSALDELF